MSTTLRAAWRVVIAVIGGTVTLIGVAMLVLPGPAFVVIPLGLSILATEFVWARQWLHKVKAMASQAVGGNRPSATPGPMPTERPRDRTLHATQPARD
jgi:hypothetical protein